MYVEEYHKCNIMDTFIYERSEMMLFLGYLLVVGITWKTFIKNDRKITKPFTEEAKLLFIQYILAIFPMVMFVSRITADDLSLRKIIIYLSILNIIVYYFILLIFYIKNRKK